MPNIISNKIDTSIFNENVLTGCWNKCKYNFYIYKNNDFKKYRHLITASLFILDIDEIYAKQKNITLEELRVEHENKTNGYINGLSNIITKCGEFNVRIFCDNTSIKYVEKFLTRNNVEIYYYHFEDFYDYDRCCHYGFFGTLVRYIPFFDFTEFEGVWETVTVVDLENNFFNSKKIIMNFIKNIRPNTPNLMFWSRPCYYLSSRMFCLELDIKNFAIISSLITQRRRQDKNIFINFINNCLLNDCEIYNRTLRRYLDIDFEKRIFGGKLEYGVDEYFINYHFLNECYYKKNNPFYVIYCRDVSGGILEWIKNIRFTIPRCEIIDEIATKEFLGIIIEYFFVERIILPDLPINDLIDWVAEQYYKLNLQYLHRKKDQTEEISKLYGKLIDVRFKNLNLYREFMFGLELNRKIDYNTYTNIIVKSNGKLFKMDLIGVLQKS